MEILEDQEGTAGNLELAEGLMYRLEEETDQHTQEENEALVTQEEILERGQHILRENDLVFLKRILELKKNSERREHLDTHPRM